MENLANSLVKREPSDEPLTELGIPNASNIKLEPTDTSPLSRFPPQSAAQTSPLNKTSQHDNDFMPQNSEGPSTDGLAIKQDPDKEPADGELVDDTETNYLERLCTKGTLEALEAGVSAATTLLHQLQDVLSIYRNPDVDDWIKTIIDLEKRTAPQRTVVGVVGNTGAGKSSVINALLDEERLLPTNCVRACTASPTEISFNYSDNPQALYRAEIEFITTEEWVLELQVLFSDLLDGSGNVSREATKTDTDANIAYAKVKAVYPQKTREMIAQANPKDLANDLAVRGVLGTKKILEERTAKQLYYKMQRYVDSEEKTTGTTEHRKKADAPMEYWPLIKVVRIFTKAKALSTGAVIVDLPGIQDSNAARAAVAANYMKLCTGLWIVAPITRAVDDKTAKTLLGDSFKRQLKYDGTYSAVTFICSKTDHISTTEAAESLGLEAEIAESWDAAEGMKREIISLQRQISDLEEARAILDQQLDECEVKTDVWEDLESQISAGQTVYAPLTNPRKRKLDGGPIRSRKKLESGVDEEWDISGSGSSDKENSQSEQNRKPLTEQEVEVHISSLRAERKKIRAEGRLLDSQIAEFRKDIKETKKEVEKTLVGVETICVKGRNNYSRGAIKHDFAMGIKELDQENAVEEDDATFDPDQDIRDYDKVARDLPVFCVSSLAYHKLNGRLVKDDFKGRGFISVEDTEIPQLQEHAKKLTEAGRTRHCRSFLNDLSQLINSMKLWSANDSTKLHLTQSEKQQEEQHLKKLLDNLEEELESSIKQLIAAIRQSLDEYIFDKVNASIPSAIEAAPETAFSWGAHRSQGGLYWATYKATVRRQGVYNGASGPRDFNQDLFNPIYRDLAPGWERAFQRRIPAALESFAKETAVKLQQFHQAAKARAEQHQTNVVGIVTLTSQIVARVRTVQALPETIRGNITESQREASREFTPVIRDVMEDAYTICTNEYGTGSYARMKDAMINHVDNARHSMFHDATEVVKEYLEAMCFSVRKDIDEVLQAVFKRVGH